jgi:hypothetical protein
MQKKVEQVIKI